MRVLLAVMMLTCLAGIANGQYILTQPDVYSFLNDYSAEPLAFEDINNNGYLDMTLGGNFTNFGPFPRVAVSFNNGSGNFGIWQNVSSGSGIGLVWKMEYGFLRGTTERDLVAAFSDRTEVLWNVNNTLSVQQTDLPAGTVLSLGRVTIDDKDDLALVTGNEIQIFRNLGGGTFLTTPIQTISEQPTFIRLVDLDNNGSFFDLVTLVGATVKVRKNSSGSFGSAANINITGLLVEIGDVNNDGYPDLLERGEGFLKIYLNDRAGNIHTTPDYQVNSSEFNFYVNHIALGDMNNDGWNDLVAAYVEAKINIWINTTAAPLFQSSPQQTVPALLHNEIINFMALGDIENTGGLAVALSSDNSHTGQGRVHVFKHDGNPAPAPPRNLSVSGQAGQHPFLQWDANTERDLSQYKIYKSYNNVNFSVLATVSSGQTSYEDVSETVITGLPQANERRAYYKITALDNQSQQSGYSNTVNIRVEGPAFDKIGGVGTEIAQIPQEYGLLQNYPNPFNPTTTIEFRLPQENHVELAVYSLTGRKIAVLVNETLEAGAYRLQWNGRDGQGNPLSSGIYIYQMISGKQRLVKKMMLIK